MLEQLVFGTLNETGSLALSAPPGSAKSTITNHFFSVWFLGFLKFIEQKTGNVIVTTNTDIIARKCGMRSREIARSDAFMQMYPHFSIARDTQSKNELHLLNVEESAIRRWEYMCSGVEGAQSGTRTDLAIFDDPYKNKESAHSPKKRAKIEDIFRTVTSTRLTGKKLKLVMHTRWRVDDLIGVEAEKSSDWTYLNLPDIAEENETFEIKNIYYQKQMQDLYGRRYYFRSVGDTIWPNHPTQDFSNHALELKQRSLSRSDYAALYKGKPFIEGGNMIKVTDFRQVCNIPTLDYKIITTDTAWCKGDKNSYTVFQLWGKFEHGAILLRQLRGRWEFGDLKRQISAHFQ